MDNWKEATLYQWKHNDDIEVVKPSCRPARKRPAPEEKPDFIGKCLYRNALEEWRVKNDLSVKEAAEKCNISVAEYNTYETGNVRIPVKYSNRISEVTGLGVGQMMSCYKGFRRHPEVEKCENEQNETSEELQNGEETMDILDTNLYKATNNKCLGNHFGRYLWSHCNISKEYDEITLRDIYKARPNDVLKTRTIGVTTLLRDCEMLDNASLLEHAPRLRDWYKVKSKDIDAEYNEHEEKEESVHVEPVVTEEKPEEKPVENKKVATWVSYSASYRDRETGEETPVSKIISEADKDFIFRAIYGKVDFDEFKKIVRIINRRDYV